MGEEDIRKFINSQSVGAPPPVKRTRPRVMRQSKPPSAPEPGFENFSATHLFCPECREATPVREKLILYLADGDLYDNLCTVCGTSVGTRKAGH